MPSWTLRSGLLLESTTPQDAATAGYYSLLAFWAGGAGQFVAPTGNQFLQTTSGSLTFQGILLKNTNKIVIGAFTPSGVLVRLTAHGLTGAFTPSGAETRQTGKIVTGLFNTGGVNILRTGKLDTGVITPTGAQTHGIGKLVSGSITPIGTLVKLFGKTLTGAFTPVGTLTKNIGKIVTGLFSTGGTIINRPGKLDSGVLTFLGVAAIRTGKIATGVLFPTLISTSDNFNRSDGDLGSNWEAETSHTLTISGNKVIAVSNSSFECRYQWIGASLNTPNYYSEADVAVFGTNSGGVGLRMTREGSSTNGFGYSFIAAPSVGQFIIKRLDGASNTTLIGGGTPVSGVTYRLRLEVSGATLRGFVDGQQVVTTSSAAYDTGLPMIVLSSGSSSGSFIDNWSGGDISEGVLSRFTTKSAFSGVLTFNGVLAASRLFVKAVSGALTFIGTLSRQTIKLVAGNLTSSGTIVRSDRPNLNGVLTLAGMVTKGVGKLIVGNLTFNGALQALKAFFKTVTGVLTFNGTLTKQTGKLVTGVLTFTGALTKLIGKLLTGNLTFNGALTSLKAFFKSISGALTFNGTLTKSVNKTLAGVLTFAGTLTKQTGKLVSGALTLSGGISRFIGKLVSGALTFLGDLQTQFISGGHSITLAGALSFVGAMSRKTGKGDAGSTGLSGNLNFGTLHTMTAVLATSGEIVKNVLKRVLGALSFTGVLSTLKAHFQALAGVLTLSGAISRQTLKDNPANLTFSGVIVKSLKRTILGALSFVGSLSSFLQRFTPVTVIGSSVSVTDVPETSSRISFSETVATVTVLAETEVDIS